LVEFARAIADDPDSASSIDTAIDGYLRTYLSADRRRRTFDGTILNALTGLAVTRAASLRPQSRTTAVLATVDRWTRGAFENSLAHTSALDASALAWIRAWGNLPVQAEPVEQVAWAHEAGRRPGTIRGVTGWMWRVAFLCQASPFLSARRLQQAEDERKWLTRALVQSVEVRPLAPADAALVAWILAESATAATPEVRSAAIDVGRGLLRDGTGASESTTAIVQRGAALLTIGRAEEGLTLIERCAAERADRPSGLLRAGENSTAGLEPHPLVLLGLVAARNSPGARP
jgi:hypothetical protein